MSEGSDKQYNFSRKNAWRKRQHKYILDNLRVPISKARGIGLIGRRGMDMWGLAAKGMKWGNFTAVENDPVVAREIRKKYGCLTICADLKDVLGAWDGDPFDFVIADFCGNLGEKMLSFAGSLSLLQVADNTPFNKRGVVACINIMRGRESTSKIEIPFMKAVVNRTLERIRDEADKHRGRGFKLYMNAAAYPLFGWPQVAYINWKYDSYRSGTIIMDSAFFVIKPEIGYSNKVYELMEKRIESVTDDKVLKRLQTAAAVIGAYKDRFNNRGKWFNKIRHKIAAAKATRTRMLV